jgi:D-glycero-D-manno-heptose 1,7-bisphosphate phosphatase
MIGDDERDIMTAHNADMRGILVSDDYTLADAVEDVLKGHYEVRV